MRGVDDVRCPNDGEMTNKRCWKCGWKRDDGAVDLVTWLRAQLDDDERVARAASAYGGAWSASEPGIYPSDQSRHPGPIVGGVWGDLEDEYAEHIARWDPARMLAEVDAKRRIIALCDSHADAQFPDSYGGYASAMEDAVQILALPYADRPGYREEWRP